MMIRPIAFCAGLALAGAAQAQMPTNCMSDKVGNFWCDFSGPKMSVPEDATKIAIDDLKARVKALEQIADELCQELAMPCPGKLQ